MADTSVPAGNKSPTYRLVAERVGKDTVDWLRVQREKGTTWRHISLNLWAEHSVDVTEVTLRKWWDDAQPEPEPANA
jgi:hypothetical protein